MSDLCGHFLCVPGFFTRAKLIEFHADRPKTAQFDPAASAYGPYQTRKHRRATELDASELDSAGFHRPGCTQSAHQTIGRRPIVAVEGGRSGAGQVHFNRPADIDNLHHRNVHHRHD